MVNTDMGNVGHGAINLFDELLRMRDEYRENTKDALMVIDGEKVPLERNRMGLYRWFLHPSLKKSAIRSQLVWIQEIPPGSRSGKLKTQGGQIHVVLEGHGYTVIDGVRHDWEQFDAIFIPLSLNGTVHQHFNSDPRHWAKLICSEPNYFDALGVDRGSGFEILEDSPDYKPR
ncbi:MAG: cupin domain-containing protein [Chloroflexi bacterium]|nr:cupin domain-containing protein [Chloroflexota bacterium]